MHSSTRNRMTVRSCGPQAIYDDEKFKIASSIYPGRYTSKNMYMNMCIIQARISKVAIV